MTDRAKLSEQDIDHNVRTWSRYAWFFDNETSGFEGFGEEPTEAHLNARMISASLLTVGALLSELTQAVKRDG